MDDEKASGTICGIPVVADEASAPMYVCQEWIDEVLIVVSEVLPYPAELIEQLSETGVTINLNLAKITSVQGKNSLWKRLVITQSLRQVSIMHQPDS